MHTLRGPARVRSTPKHLLNHANFQQNLHSTTQLIDSMTDTSPPLVPDDEQSRDRLRAALAVCCVAAVVLAGTVVPAVSSGGLGGTPLGSIVPQPGVDPYQDAPAGAGSGGGAFAGAGALGALNPGDRTSVGGSLADANDSSAFRSRNAEVHFTVRSSMPAYWRTGAYDTYTGSGWERTEDREPYAGPLDGGGTADRRVEYRVRLNRSATALPTVWRPESVSGPDSLLVTDRRAFVSDRALPAGTAYEGVSHRPPRDEAVLQTAGRDYPAEIEGRYTDLPADTERRLGDFTANLTADADTPYETATQVEAWLEANKDYSLNVTPPEDDVASQFVFEMDEGYCEYFATAMTAMLRSQGVPARYVVGYSTGQQVEPGTYEVRGMNAHAWVEVYFPDVGWVRFDPTPGSDRLEAEQEAFENQTDDPAAEYEPTEEGSPGETFSANDSDPASPGDASTGTATSDDADGSGETSAPPGGTTGGDGTTGEGSDAGTTTGGSPESGENDSGDSDESDESENSENSNDSDDPAESPLGGYDVSLNRTPVPGATVTATVTRDGAPASGVDVLFNGDRIGTTDDAGAVEGRVPYARNLTITVRDDSDEAASLGGSPLASDDASPAFGGFPLASDATASLASPPLGMLQAENERNETNGTNDSHSYSLETNATVAVSGDRVTGNEVVVTATVEDVALRNAEVRLDGERVAETDRKGRATIRLPESPGNATVAVSRGAVAGETTVSLPELNVTVEPSLPLALPGTEIEVSAAYEGEPVSGANVTVGDAEATTDMNGTATAALPFRRSATAVVSVHGQTRSETVSGLLLNLFGVLAGAAVVVGGLGFGAYRRGATPRRVARVLLAALAALPRLAIGALFGVVDAIERGIRTVIDALRELWDEETTLHELFDRLRAWLRERLRDARARARWSLAGFADDSAPDDPSRGAEADDSYRTLREAWRDFLLAVSVRQPDAMTPGELAAHAVREDGLPGDAVATLRDAFRDVEYGARSPAERLPSVEDALSAIEDATRGPGDEPGSPNDGPDSPRDEPDSPGDEPNAEGGER